jgi:hypothetical protein
MNRSASDYLAQLELLGPGTVSLSIVDAKTAVDRAGRGTNIIEWIEVEGEACVPTK